MPKKIKIKGLDNLKWKGKSINHQFFSCTQIYIHNLKGIGHKHLSNHANKITDAPFSDKEPL